MTSIVLIDSTLVSLTPSVNKPWKLIINPIPYGFGQWVLYLLEGVLYLCTYGGLWGLGYNSLSLSPWFLNLEVGYFCCCGVSLLVDHQSCPQWFWAWVLYEEILCCWVLIISFQRWGLKFRFVHMLGSFSLVFEPCKGWVVFVSVGIHWPLGLWSLLVSYCVVLEHVFVSVGIHWRLSLWSLVVSYCMALEHVPYKNLTSCIMSLIIPSHGN
jgi:hypothetical protein